MLFVLGVGMLGPAAVLAEEKIETGQAERQAEPWTVQELKSESSHRVTVGGRNLSYKATAGTLILKDEDGTQKASVFFMA